MNVKERVISMKLIGKKQEYKNFLEEIGVMAVMKEKVRNLETEEKEKYVKEEM